MALARLNCKKITDVNSKKLLTCNHFISKKPGYFDGFNMIFVFPGYL
jgi:hypothetical protein